VLTPRDGPVFEWEGVSPGLFKPRTEDDDA
jgi:hypothetical protein